MYNKGHIHFVGIGGIGMSGIAKILKQQGYIVSGCDKDIAQKSVLDLINLGCQIFEGNNTQYCHSNSIDILVYSTAIQENNPEIQAARQRSIPTIPRALMLSELMRTKYSIAITGAHGKTTTTSIIAHILIEAKKDPTIIIGGHLTNLSTNAVLGGGDFLIAEADESDKSLLRLYPTLGVVTNIDLEHLDIYKDIEDIKKTFTQFLGNIPFYGKAFVCIDDPHIQSILPLPHVKTIKYGLNKDLSDIYAEDISLEKDHSLFTVYLKNNPEPLGTIYLNMPGRHNILNSLAAIAVSLDLEIPFNIISQALQNFTGIDRRFSFKRLYNGAELFDDYGHHPTEIFNALLVARKRANNKLIVVFQPHKYTRTQQLWSDFVNVFAYSSIDHLIITDIYPASENAIPEITSMNLIKAIKEKQPSCNITYVPYESSFNSIKSALDSIASTNDLILTLGAGKLNNL